MTKGYGVSMVTAQSREPEIEGHFVRAGVMVAEQQVVLDILLDMQQVKCMGQGHQRSREKDIY